MAPLIIQLTCFGIMVGLRLTALKGHQSFAFLDRAGAISIGVVFFVAGIAHFTMTEQMALMFPKFVPMRIQLVYASGVMEVLLGLTLIYGTSNDKWIGVSLMIFLIMSLPLNIYSAVQNIGLGAKGINYLWFRVPLQVFWFGWIYKFVIK